MERGSDKHGPRQDEELKAELNGMLGSAGGHREEWKDPEPAADDDERIARLRHDMDVANDSRFEDRDLPDGPDA